MSQRYEKQPAGEIVVQNKFVKWLDNFWYHYKWQTIFVAFFLFVGIVCFAQCSTSQNASDMRIAYAGGFQPSAQQQQNIEDVLEAISPDRNTPGAGSLVAMNTFAIFTEEEMDILSFDEEAGKVHTPTKNQLRSISSNNLKEFDTYSKTGDSAVWFVSEYVYTNQKYATSNVKPLMSLAELYPDGNLPVGAYDEYAIRLSNTELYQYYDALKVFPEDTLVVMPRQLVLGSSSDDATYAYFTEMFRAIVEFKAPVA